MRKKRNCNNNNNNNDNDKGKLITKHLTCLNDLCSFKNKQIQNWCKSAVCHLCNY